MIARALILASITACLPQKAATEIVVTVDTTFGVPCTIDALHFTIAGASGTVEQDVPLADGDLPGSITLVPTDDDHVTLTTIGMRGGEPFATSTADVAFASKHSLEVRVVLDDTCVHTPCAPVGIGDYRALPPALPRRGCGATSYAIAPSVFAMRDACDLAGAVVDPMLTNADEVERPLPPMPFPFHFYDQLVTNLWVGTNGYLAFGDAQPHALIADIGAPRDLGKPGFPVRGALPFWDDLRTSAKGICVATSGSAPDRIQWITWEEACFSSGAGQTKCAAATDGALTFGVALEETTDRLYFGYLRMMAPDQAHASGNTATIGITDDVPKGCAACQPDGTCPAGAGGGACGYTQESSFTAIDLSAVYALEPGP